MSKEHGSITAINREIIDQSVKKNSLSVPQREKLEEFSEVDNEWRTLMAIGNRYAGTSDRLDDLDQIREHYLSAETDPVLAKAIREYADQVDLARFENEP